MVSKVYNIAIDGPAGAGKSTIARKTASLLGFIYIDTGAMYRAMALQFFREGIEAGDEPRVAEACGEVGISIRYEDGMQQILLNGENVSGLIRTEEVGRMASAISVYLPVREKLVRLQQDLARQQHVVMDGRDIGTCVLPDADLKIYLTASSHVRAIRRFKELEAKGLTCNLEEIEQDIIERDHRDMNRDNSPLKQADDAVLLDSSQLTIDQVIGEILRLAGERGMTRA